MIPGLVIDNFAGGGGASTGIEVAIGRAIDVAINHDDEALAMSGRIWGSTARVGAIDPEIIKQRLGGGVYRLVIKRGRLSTSRNLTVAGAPRVLAMEPDAAPTSTSPATPSSRRTPTPRW